MDSDVLDLDLLLCGRYQTWLFSIVASCVVGLTGVVPLLIIPIEVGVKLKRDEGSSKTLRLLLSFAVGGLLGDVFLHLLPEAWNRMQKGQGSHSAYMTLGMWILSGIFTFIVIEIMFANSVQQSSEKPVDSTSRFCNKVEYANGHVSSTNGVKCVTAYVNGGLSNGYISTSQQLPATSAVHRLLSNWEKAKAIHISGYLNLMANGIDNFTHGLAVAASFLVGTKMGLLTTLAILIHEIPHEVGDFAILLRSGFNRWDAAKAQVSTAVIGLLGTVTALSAESAATVGERTVWILPFTCGGFLNIALVNVLPDLMKEEDPWESFKQVVCICGGIGMMALVSTVAT